MNPWRWAQVTRHLQTEGRAARGSVLKLVMTGESSDACVSTVHAGQWSFMGKALLEPQGAVSPRGRPASKAGELTLLWGELAVGILTLAPGAGPGREVTHRRGHSEVQTFVLSEVRGQQAASQRSGCQQVGSF